MSMFFRSAIIAAAILTTATTVMARPIANGLTSNNEPLGYSSMPDENDRIFWEKMQRKSD